eukprot:TRINITY_DN1536_c0_g1_i10.p1 TRINITY_DN1536_c0_g1~~TRINITY_DN1536_c0_g1_i10.p1  ORF type:complete len:239 (-),score=55.43 TRINITY_DN1536_c0_g1_i10:4-720(-)
MARVKVYLDFLSQPSRAMYIFCKATGIQHEIVLISTMREETKTDKFTALNPLQQVPVLKDGNFALTESVAMLRYLANTRDIADHWYPKDTKQQARVDEYLEWQHIGTRFLCSSFFMAKMMKPMKTRIPPNEKNVQNIKDVMEKQLELVERIWLKNGEKDFIGGGKDVSVADLLAACEMEQPRMAGYDVRDKSPVLKLYMDRVQDRLNPHYAEAHVGLNEMVKKFKGEVPESHYKKIDA